MSEKIAWGFNTFDSEAYGLGQKAAIKYELTGEDTDNPYLSETNPWYSWNSGWNSVGVDYL